MSIKDQPSTANLNFKKLKRMYLFALVTIAITVLLSQLLIQSNLKSQLHDSRLINISGKQRMLSQKLVKEILVYTTTTDSTRKNSELQKITATFSTWKNTHFALKNGDDDLHFPKESSLKIENLYRQIQPHFDAIVVATTDLISSKNNVIQSKNVSTILDNESAFLSKMNQIVGQYEKEALEKVRLQRNTEYGILSFTLFLLLLEFLFIFKPTTQRIEILIAKLLTSEKKAIKLAYDTEVLSEIKEDSVKELKSLNYALENSLLYCRLTPDGKIIHMGEQFCKLLQYNMLSAEDKFSQALSSLSQEQAYIDQLIKDKHRSSWHGELKATTKNDVVVWLDLSIVPVTIKKGNSELLVICFDITERKKAEQEVERLNRAQIADKLNQQKTISSKIVENQEHEQNRIAREIHDGIGQMLTGLKFSLESIDVNDKDKTEQKITYLKKLSLDIIKGVRTATFNLMPPELSDYGIAASLSKLTTELGKLTGKNIVFYNKTNFDKRLDSLIEINCYRLTQEAVNNAIKYAESIDIAVQLSHSNSILSIIIDDKGKGFDVTQVEEKRNSESGMGLLFMKERIQYINGRVFINSIPGEGTRITFNIPI
ncbi:type IV pili methyl-accepting chemotaxis transducer N-terminal domain-containing protein [Flavobacterium frigidarium]|uniref:sensor histidine kinase n=1 Tax=Flavobacterium frigidarium TaxID=99286 RepID=UPI0030D876AC|tara:strand:- start:4727 stop:6523 length:1797 start_codon:yes stop_codon:yes gene_type:complete